MENKPTLGQISGEKTNIKALASETVDRLTRYISRETPTGSMLLGTVTAVSAGPPTTITATVNGQEVSSIRFLSTGVTPDVADTIVILVHQQRYVCVGVLA